MNSISFRGLCSLRGAHSWVGAVWHPPGVRFVWEQYRCCNSGVPQVSKLECDDKTGQCRLLVVGMIDKKIWQVASEMLRPHDFNWDPEGKCWVGSNAGNAEQMASTVQDYIVGAMKALQLPEEGTEEEEIRQKEEWVRSEAAQNSVYFNSQFDMDNPLEREKSLGAEQSLEKGVTERGLAVFSEESPLDARERVEIFLEDISETVGSLLPSHVEKRRFMQVVLETLLERKDLFKFDANSVRKCVLRAAMLGLEPGKTDRYCYFLPVKNTLHFVMGYRGLIELALRTGEVVSFTAKCVYQEDQFELEGDVIKHVPYPNPHERGELTLVYAICVLKGVQKTCVLSRSDFAKNRMIAKRLDDPLSPWFHWQEEMFLKTAVKRLARRLSLSTEKKI